MGGRANPGARRGGSLRSLCYCDVVVDFTHVRMSRWVTLWPVWGAGVHVVIGTTGFDVSCARGCRLAPTSFVAPNFAIGAVLMMRFAAEASRHMAAAEIIELHHDGKLDAPSGTAARTAELMAQASGRPRAADPLGSPAGAARQPGGDPRRPRPDADDPPRHDLARVVHARVLLAVRRWPRCPARRWRPRGAAVR